LAKLSSLDVSDNDLGKLPEWLGQLHNLMSLDVSGNALKVLPDSIKNLRNLIFFHLDKNSIARIPSETIQPLTQLYHLSLTDNPLEEPPIDVAQKGIVEIRKYYRQLEEEGQDHLYEAKLLIVGEGGAGKTSLAR